MKAACKALNKKIGKKEDEYEMPKPKAIAEHKRLVKVLGSKKGLAKERALQKAELKEIKEED